LFDGWNDGDVMVLAATTLGDELKSMALFGNESDAISAWAASYREYFEGATANGVTVLSAALVAPEAAMIGAMTGLSTGGALSIQAGIVAFWTALALLPAAAWPTSILITPPPLLAGIAAALEPVFLANTTGGLSKDASMSAIATAIHTNSLTGSVTWPGPSAFPVL
jgi:hypothetical protein